MTTIARVLSAVTQGLYFCSKRGILTYVSKSSYHRMIFAVVFLTTILQCFDAVGWAAGRASGL